MFTANSRGAVVKGTMVACLLVAWAVPQALGTPIVLTLSSHSSEPGTVPVTLLDADAAYSVVADVLTLTVANENDVGGLVVNQVFFNATDNVTALSLRTASHSEEGDVTNKWNFDFIQGGGPGGGDHQVDGFGLFDAYLIDGNPNNKWTIGPQESVVFIIDITAGSGTYATTDFTTDLSNQVDHHELMLVAAKFADGANESAYGGFVPEPASICLLSLGALALLRSRRRRK